jgi:hypothetical protein
MTKARKDLTGWIMKEHGVTNSRLIVIRQGEDYIDPTGKHRTMWICECTCKSTDRNTITASPNAITSGQILSCGCINKERLIQQNIDKSKHSMCNTRLYRIWKQMHTRCYNVNDEHYSDYGQRGITICDLWKDNFLEFYNWSINNGYKDNLSIDRIDVNGNYEPSNCRWATIKKQQNNKRNSIYLTYNNETHTISEWHEIMPTRSLSTMYNRYHAGWSAEDILTK